MNICLVGSLASYKAFDELVKNSKAKPSNAPENFQMMLAKGLRNNNVPITALAFPTMEAYPNGAALICRKDREIIEDNILSIHMPMINLQGLKQLSIFWETYWYVKKWIKKTSDKSKYVLIYSDYPPYASAARLACKGNDAKVILVMTDLPTYKNAGHKMSAYTFL